MKQSPTLELLLAQLGNELYYHRHTTKQKIVSVSKAVGVSHAVISRIENGRYEALTLSLLKKLADYYEVPLASLFIAGDGREDGFLLDYLQAEIAFLRESHRELLKAHNNSTIVGDI